MHWLVASRQAARAACLGALCFAFASLAPASEAPAPGATLAGQIDYWMRDGYDRPDAAIAALNRLEAGGATPAQRREL
ncbi:MAG TPA: hypothetical protein PL196_09110, partial [Burkholderiaceae bacterium]|nr:hypothetical protein [Burkholderiaceae bacterium]